MIYTKILDFTKADSVEKIELIQKLWNNYGELSRVHLKGCEHQTVILKHAKIPEETFHPKGFNSSISQQRKIRSYEVETTWYQNYNEKTQTAKCLGAFQKDGEFFILLEDLDQRGLTERPNSLSFEQIKVVIKWLAIFHAKHLQQQPKGLWETGTYWHLKTRPDELKEMKDSPLKDLAGIIDRRLSTCTYQTIVHGDAKLANFCFSKDLKSVAAVDFQYVGGGCGMKDLAYFIGSCLSEEESEKHENQILDIYFKELENASSIPDIQQCILEWRELYQFAWADFHRFLKGWSPDHWKINAYSETITSSVINKLLSELTDIAKTTAIEAGELIMSYYQKDFDVSYKDGNTQATSIVTEVDLKAQKLILDRLDHLSQKYDFGLLAEESDNDKSRLEKDFFWTIDPIDGTLYFSEGKPGFAVSIALVSKNGESYLGVVYDPVKRELFHAQKGSGSFLNGERFKVNKEQANAKILFADRSLKDSDQFEELKTEYEILFEGGAVLNALNAVRFPSAFYIKQPKKELGGCSTWDIAATSLIVNEAGGRFTDYSGKPLNLNKKDSIFYHSEGLYVCS